MVVVDIHHPGVGSDALRNLVRVVRSGQPGSKVEELSDPDLSGQVANHPLQERPRLTGVDRDLRVQLHPGVAGALAAREPARFATRDEAVARHLRLSGLHGLVARTPTEASVNLATVVATADVVGRSRAGCRFRRIPVVVVTTEENEEGSECSTC
jgi:hypothetical protein